MSEPTPATGTRGRDDDVLAELADDFLRRHRAGESPSVDEYAQKHPELAARIRDLFPAMLAMEQSELGPAMTAPRAERIAASPLHRRGHRLKVISSLSRFRHRAQSGE
jgi:hypothetical protein